MLSGMYKAKDKGIGTYITCPATNAKRALNTGIFRMTESFNSIYDDTAELLSLRKFDFKEHSKRNNTYFKQLIEEIKTENWTVQNSSSDDPDPDADRQWVMDNLVYLVHYNHILGDLKSITSCQSADFTVNKIEYEFCQDTFRAEALSILFFMIAILAIGLTAVGFNKLILIIDRDARKSLRGNKKYQGDDLDEDEEEEMEDGSRQIY